jgi:cytochrome c5
MARSIVGHCLRQLCALGVLVSYASPAWSQTPDGARVFQASCATCHTGAPDSRAPGVDSLRVRTPQAILDSLVTGAMRPQGSRLSGPERRAVAEFITGKSIEGDVSGARVGRCSTSGPLQGPGAVVAGGMVYVNSGFGAFGGRPGNVLLAFGPE